MVGPARGPRLSMRLRDVLFAHWPMPPAHLDARLPEGLRVDTFEGNAYLGVVCMEVTESGPAMLPFGRSYGQLNVRTYVTHESGPGVYFLSLDVGDPLVACLSRGLFGLPAHSARTTFRRAGEEVTAEVRRAAYARFAATYARDGDPFTPEEDSLEAFLTDRERYYVERGGRLLAGDLDHEPWRLFPARIEVTDDSLLDVTGNRVPEKDPFALYARRLDVTAGRPFRLPDT